MKKIIILVMVAAFLCPSAGIPFESLKKTTKIDKDKHGGYSETQTDYHQRMSRQYQEKKKGAYYDHGYHIKSKQFKQGDEQFIRSYGADKGPKKKQKKKK